MLVPNNLFRTCWENLKHRQCQPLLKLIMNSFFSTVTETSSISDPTKPRAIRLGVPAPRTWKNGKSKMLRRPVSEKMVFGTAICNATHMLFLGKAKITSHIMGTNLGERGLG